MNTSFKYQLLIVITLLCSRVLFAQNTEDLSASRHRKLGWQYEMAGDKYAAIQHFSAYVNKRPENRYYLIKLAGLYFDIRNYPMAEDNYRKALKLYKNPPAELLFNFGRVLKMNGKYEEAKTVFNTYRKKTMKNNKNNYLRKQAKIEIEGCEKLLSGAYTDTLKKVEITILDTSVNKFNIEYAPFPINENTFIYSSVKTNQPVYYFSSTEKYSEYSQFYLARKEGNQWKGGIKMTDSFNIPGKNVGNGYLCPHGNRFYFTVCEPDHRHKPVCTIWYSELNGSHWSAPVKLPKSINKPGTISTQPAAGLEPRQNREVLYFVSNRKGGKGGFDIWYSLLDPKTNEYSEPKNCGSKVNTPMNELTPFVDQNTNKFYFSSDGHPGIGGQDIFSTSGALRKWVDPENIGLPFNSSTDDLWFRTIPQQPQSGFFVSNRANEISMLKITCCDDIFSFNITNAIFLKISGRVISFENLKKELFIEEFIDKPYKGIPPEGKLLDSATVYLVMINDKEEIPVKSHITSANGTYLFSLEPDRQYKLTASKNGYFSSNYSLSTINISKTDSFFHDFILKKIPEQPVIIKNIYYLFDKYTLTDSAKAVIDTTIYQLMIDNPEIKVEISSHTDSKGSESYNMSLSQKRAQSVVNYLIKKGISPERLTAKGYGESFPVAPNENPDGSDNPEGRAKNRRTEFKVTGFLPQNN